MRTLTLKQRPLPSFLDVRSSLLLEELTLQQSDESSSSAPSAFVARGAPTPSPPRGPADNNAPPRRPDVCRNFQRGSCRFGARCRYLHSAPPQQQGGIQPNTPGKGPQAPWPSMQNPWAGSIQMWPGQPHRPPFLGSPQAHHAVVSSTSHAVDARSTRTVADHSTACTDIHRSISVLRPRFPHAGFQHHVPDATVIECVVHGFRRFRSHDRQPGASAPRTRSSGAIALATSTPSGGRLLLRTPSPPLHHHQYYDVVV